MARKVDIWSDQVAERYYTKWKGTQTRTKTIWSAGVPLGDHTWEPVAEGATRAEVEAKAKALGFEV